MTINIPGLAPIERSHWHQLDSAAGAPFYYGLLTIEQRGLLQRWLDVTEGERLVGETSVSAMGMLAGLILGNRIGRVVQCGHYAGYSLLVLGMLMRNAQIDGHIISFDIDQNVTRFTQDWITEAGLDDTAHARVMDSADPFCMAECMRVMTGPPDLVFIDSSHQYRHTLDELDLWSNLITPGGFIAFHDASRLAAVFDHHKAGGVRGALDEWLARNKHVNAIIIDPLATETAAPIYLDPCGFALLQVQPDKKRKLIMPGPKRRIIADPSFAQRDAWILGDGWEWTRRGIVKKPGVSSALTCYAPVISGERYKIEVELAKVKSGGLSPGAGGSDASAFISGNGDQSCVIQASSINAMVGVLASADFDGRVVRFDAQPVT